MHDDQMPDPDYEDPKQMYALFGLTFYRAQVLEQGLVNFLVALRDKETGLPAGELDELIDEARSKTFRKLLSAARKLGTIPDGLDMELGQVLEHRDRLAHRFFVENDEAMMTDNGRRSMIDELLEILRFIVRVDRAFDEVWMAAWAHYGMTPEWYEAQLSEWRDRLARA